MKSIEFLFLFSVFSAHFLVAPLTPHTAKASSSNQFIDPGRARLEIVGSIIERINHNESDTEYLKEPKLGEEFKKIIFLFFFPSNSMERATQPNEV